MGNLREHELHSAVVAQLGFIPGAIHYCAKTGTVTHGFLRDDRRIPASRLHMSFLDAYDAAARQNGNNNVVMVTPDQHVQTGALTLNKNLTHLVGMYKESRQNMRSRIAHSAVTVPSFISMTGAGNLVKNIFFQYGGDFTTDLNLLTDTGGRNTYENCHFLIENVKPVDQSAFDLIRVHHNELFFKNCQFGNETVLWTAGNMIEFATSGGEAPRAVFENCVFLMDADAADPTFLKCGTVGGTCLILFRGCQFINMGTTLTLAIDGAGLANAQMYFDQNCSFHGVTDVVAAAYEDHVHTGASTYTAAATSNLLGGTADHT
jgi:hypothetical protein